MQPTQAFFSSHRNSLEAHLSLLETIQCCTILLPENAPAVTKQILAGRSMQILTMPGMDFFISDSKSDRVEDYEWHETFDSMRDKTFIILYTSGSTGIPKPVYVIHGTFACNNTHQLIPSLGGKQTTVYRFQRKRLFLIFPLFHIANLTFTIGYGVFSSLTCVLLPPEPLSVDIVNLVHIWTMYTEAYCLYL